MFSSDFRFNTAPGTAVPYDYDFPLHINTVFGKNFIVLRNSVIRINQFRGNIAVRRIDIIRRKLFFNLTGSHIFFQGGFRQRCSENDGRGHFKLTDFWCWEENVKFLNSCIKSPRLKLRFNELGIRLVPGRSDMMRMGGQPAHPNIEIIGLQKSIIFLLYFLLLIISSENNSNVQKEYNHKNWIYYPHIQLHSRYLT